MRLLLVEMPDNLHTSLGTLSYSKLLTIGKWYEGDLTPTIYDPETLLPAGPYYIIHCDDYKLRKVEGKYFISVDEVRDKKLNELGI